MADPSDKTKQTLFTRTTTLVWSALSLMLALQWSMDLGTLGFPDGYITTFARATSTLLGILTAACMVQGLYFFLAGVFGRKVSAVGLCLQILAAAVLTVVPVLIVKDCPHSQLCSRAYEALTGTMMDDGAGG